LAGGLAAFTLGILDDKFGTHPGAKFIVQLSIAFALVLFGVRIRIVPTPLAVPLSLIWVVMLTNAFNLIDNMDGLSAGTATIASLTIFGLTYEKNGQETVPILALALAGACLGFLRYNFNPARIFMGDCGSLFLGFTLSALAILGFWQDASSPVFSALTAPALIMGYAIFDTILVTVLRLKNGGYPWVGGKDHSSHRLVRLGLSEKNAMLSLYSFGVIGSLSALVIQRSSTMIGLPLVTTLTLIAIGFGWYLDKAQGKK
jgi:UDP-GlcNAc:undecaprenyl-phosphate GlcNAc-1-phosphate transferase